MGGGEGDWKWGGWRLSVRFGFFLIVPTSALAPSCRQEYATMLLIINYWWGFKLASNCPESCAGLSAASPIVCCLRIQFIQ
ncbi:hypothetical protein T492DRAFT_517401 [Pavlovales sp. CCMP2436]|nr:hypothetical protein T492DRAFT_517401 [Pavlovales sp. CCMP2436]